MAHTIVGGPEGNDPNDVLDADAGGRRATVAADSVLVEGMAPIRYFRIGRVIIRNQPGATPRP